MRRVPRPGPPGQPYDFRVANVAGDDPQVRVVHRQRRRAADRGAVTAWPVERARSTRWPADTAIGTKTDNVFIGFLTAGKLRRALSPAPPRKPTMRKLKVAQFPSRNHRMPAGHRGVPAHR